MNDGVPVLVVDDDKSIQGIVEETLIEDGFRPNGRRCYLWDRAKPF